MGEIKPFLSSCTFIFDHIFYCAFFIILILVGIDKEENQFGNNLEWFHSFDMKIHKKLQKKSQNLLKVLPKTVLFRNIALIFSLEKPCYLENRVVREPCKRRSACICFSFNSLTIFFRNQWLQQWTEVVVWLAQLIWNAKFPQLFHKPTWQPEISVNTTIWQPLNWITGKLFQVWNM